MDKEVALNKNNFNHSSSNELYRKQKYVDKLKQEIKNDKRKINNYTKHFHQINIKNVSNIYKFK